MAKGEASGEILNNTGTMEYQKASRQLSVSFRCVIRMRVKVSSAYCVILILGLQKHAAEEDQARRKERHGIGDG